MPKFMDAIGYLTELVEEVDEPWFSQVIDYACEGNSGNLSQERLNTLLKLLRKSANYVSSSSKIETIIQAGPSDTTEFLERITGFKNFKRLSDSLEVVFNKQVSLVFGTNGSGKSSLCESLKLLAVSQPPIRPLENLIAKSTETTQFSYKFASKQSLTTWTSGEQLGLERASIKYFDTEFAVKALRDPVETKTIIELSPFRLYLFESSKDLITQFREVLQKEKLVNSEALRKLLAETRSTFAAFKGYPLATIDEKSLSCLTAEIATGRSFNETKILADFQKELDTLERAASEDGLNLLRAAHGNQESLAAAVKELLANAEWLWNFDAPSKKMLIDQKYAERAIIASVLTTSNEKLDQVYKMIQDASLLCDLSNPEGDACPLCKRDLGLPEIQLFKQYAELLSNTLEQELQSLRNEYSKAGEISKSILKFDTTAWQNFGALPKDMVLNAKSQADKIIADCEISKAPFALTKETIGMLKLESEKWEIELKTKKAAIDAAEQGSGELRRRIAELRLSIEPLEYAQAIADKLSQLSLLEETSQEAAFFTAELLKFPQVLKKLTDKAKEAHEQLVVADFESRLNAEYVALTEKDMHAFGVRLSRKGAEGSVALEPRIGSALLQHVMSEGEQRVHALALLFAELETSAHSVIVFDDPVSSFDFNYIENFCIRLRNFVKKFLGRQIIVLTHNWEFFVQLQTALNKARLDTRLSVQVLENCSIAGTYSDDVETLKNEITQVLDMSEEPDKKTKESVAGKLRRLIEAIVNTHVFNKERHQYKQKSLQVSTFGSFTKVTPLLEVEAEQLKDLYAKFSVAEHDDPRNHYVNADKVTFKARYDKILKIEADITSRRPS